MKVYVGNLPFSATEADVRSKFEAYGPLAEVAIIADRDTGRPRGFGFVTFQSSDDANKAIEALNGTDMDGRSLRVNQAEERSRGGGGGRGGRGGGGRDRW